MFTWVENEIITINPGKESKKVRDGKFQTDFRDPRTVWVTVNEDENTYFDLITIFSIKSDKTTVNKKCLSPVSQGQKCFYNS